MARRKSSDLDSKIRKLGTALERKLERATDKIDSLADELSTLVVDLDDDEDQASTYERMAELGAELQQHAISAAALTDTIDKLAELVGSDDDDDDDADDD